MTPPKIIVHLLSGGLDSVVLLYDLVSKGHRVHCALFDYKQRHAQELLWAKQHCHRLNIMFTTMELPVLKGSRLTDGKGSVVVPFRNGVMLSLAINLAVAADADTITFGANEEDSEQFPDCRLPFVDAMNEVVKQAGYEIEICAPYARWKKWQIVAHGQELGVRFNETWSCYEGGVQPCGKCEACLKRDAAFKLAATA